MIQMFYFFGYPSSVLSLSLTSPDVPQSLGLALHPHALPVAGPLQVEGGDERQSDAGQVLLHTAAGHPDQRGQRVLADGVIDAVCQHVAWRGRGDVRSRSLTVGSLSILTSSALCDSD